jgi:putative transposase
VAPYLRRTQSLEALLPWLYLKAFFKAEMNEALKGSVGLDAEGLSESLNSEFLTNNFSISTI